jgi:predicted nucleic acid-binding protein
LAVLRSVAGERVVVIPDAVEFELREGALSHPHLNSILAAEWIKRVALSSEAELQAFAHFSSLLVAGNRNVGEAAVLAYAKTHTAIAVVDDGAARRAARDANVSQQGTLGLLCEAIRNELLTVAVVADVADHLLETEYRLPFAAGGFERWAKDNGLLGPAST